MSSHILSPAQLQLLYSNFMTQFPQYIVSQQQQRQEELLLKQTDPLQDALNKSLLLNDDIFGPDFSQNHANNMFQQQQNIPLSYQQELQEAYMMSDYSSLVSPPPVANFVYPPAQTPFAFNQYQYNNSPAVMSDSLDDLEKLLTWTDDDPLLTSPVLQCMEEPNFDSVGFMGSALDDSSAGMFDTDGFFTAEPTLESLQNDSMPYCSPTRGSSTRKNFIAAKPHKIDKRKELELLFSEHVKNLKPSELQNIFPAICEPDWSSKKGSIFSKKQEAELREQLEQHFHITAYSYLMNSSSSKEKRSSGPTFWEEELLSLYELSKKAKEGDKGSVYADIFDIESVPDILNCEPMVKMRVGTYVKLAKTGFKEEKPKKTKKEAKKCKINPHNPKALANRKFTIVEDELLFKGVSIFGFDEPKTIQAHCLPVKTYKQIYDRLRYKTSRACKPNEIKDLYLRPYKPLVCIERHVMREGIAVFGQRFYKMAEKIFVSVPRDMLQYAWEVMVKCREVEEPFIYPAAWRSEKPCAVERLHNIPFNEAIAAECVSPTSITQIRRKPQKKKQAQPRAVEERQPTFVLNKRQNASEKLASVRQPFHSLASSTAVTHVNIGRGKMYVRTNEFKYNQLSTIAGGSRSTLAAESLSKKCKATPIARMRRVDSSSGYASPIFSSPVQYDSSSLQYRESDDERAYTLREGYPLHSSPLDKYSPHSPKGSLIQARSEAPGILVDCENYANRSNCSRQYILPPATPLSSSSSINLGNVESANSLKKKRVRTSMKENSSPNSLFVSKKKKRTVNK